MNQSLFRIALLVVLHHAGTWHGFLLRQQGATALFHQRHLPSIYIQGYDGDDIWLALTEDEVKQFESEKELPLSSFDNAQYRERKSVVEKQYPQARPQFRHIRPRAQHRTKSGCHGIR